MIYHIVSKKIIVNNYRGIIEPNTIPFNCESLTIGSKSTVTLVRDSLPDYLSEFIQLGSVELTNDNIIFGKDIDRIILGCYRSYESFMCNGLIENLHQENDLFFDINCIGKFLLNNRNYQNVYAYGTNLQLMSHNGKKYSLDMESCKNFDLFDENQMICAGKKSNILLKSCGLIYNR